MSQYTTELRFVCETLTNSEPNSGYVKADKIIPPASKIILGEYPIFDEKYRDVLNEKIVRHYYTREISEETVGLWLFRIRTKMREIMPYYNELYKSAELKFDPLNPIDYTVNRNRKTDGVSESVGERNDKRKSNGVSTSGDETDGKTVEKFSDTPQGSLDRLESDKYMSQATINTTNNANKSSNEYEDNDNNISNDTRNDTAHSTEEYVERYAGRMGIKSASKLLKEYRETLLNIDMMVIEELGELFFGLW